MVKSQNGLITAQLIHPQTRSPFPEVTGWDKSTYVIGEPRQSFQIRMTATKKSSVYGCTLSIDGQIVCKSKSFKDVGHFFGFRKMDNEYEMFEFMIPEMQQDFALVSSSKAKELKEKMGRIVIEIYDVKKIKLSTPFFQQNPNKFKSDYTPMKRLQDKKLYAAPLTIKRGGIYKHKNSFKNNTKDGFVDRMDLEKHLDTLVIRYSDFYTLVILDHINLYNKEHLQYIPIHYIKKNLCLLEKMIITIIRSFKKMKKFGLSERFLSDELKRYTKMRFEELGVGSLRDYLLSKRDIFLYNPETDNFMLRNTEFNPTNESLIDLKAGNLIDVKYYTVPMDKENFIFKKPTLNCNGDNNKPKEIIIIEEE